MDLNATMVASTNAAGQTVITVTLTQSSGSLSTVNGNTTLIWTPSGSCHQYDRRGLCDDRGDPDRLPEEELLTWPVAWKTGDRTAPFSYWRSCS